MSIAKNDSDFGPSNRGMTAQETAKLYGISLSSFRLKRQKGEIPGPTLPCDRYDRALILQDMDRRSGISGGKTPTLSPLDEWRSRHGSSKP
jgi:hypothetical protein